MHDFFYDAMINKNSMIQKIPGWYVLSSGISGICCCIENLPIFALFSLILILNMSDQHLKMWPRYIFPHTVPECSAAVGCLYRLFPHWHLMMILILGTPPPPDQTRCLHHRRDAGMELLCIMRAVTRPGSRSGPGIIINYGISRQLYQNLKSQ